MLLSNHTGDLLLVILRVKSDASFVIRLDKLTELLMITDIYMKLGDSHIEGIDVLFGRFNTPLSALKKKSYDPLDQRKPDFDYDFEDFKKQVQEIQVRVLVGEDMVWVRVCEYGCVCDVVCE